MRDRIRYLFVVVAMCGMIATSLGILTNVAGLFFTSVAEEFGSGMGAISLTLTICNFSYALAGMMAPKFITEKNFRFMLVAGTSVIAGATALMSAAGSIGVLYLLSALRGFAGGFLGMVLVTLVINNWFLEKNGLVTSIVTACSGLAGAGLSPVISSVISDMGWRRGYLFTALLVLLLNLPAMVLPIGLTPRAAGMEPFGRADLSVDSGGEEEVKNQDAVLLTMVLLFGFMASFVTAFPQHFPKLAASYSLTAATGAAMLSFCMMFNTAGKVLLGVLMDRIGTKRSLLLYGVCVIGALVVLLLGRSAVLATSGALVYGFSYAFAIVGGVMMTKELYGPAEYARVYPLVSLAITIANAAGSSLIGVFYDVTGTYTSTLLLLLAMMAAVVVIILAAYRRSVQKTPVAVEK